MIARNRTACFTGHRNIPINRVAALEKLLDRVIELLYHKGVVFYGAGGSYGFDLLAEKAVLRAKERHNDIKLILVLPCRNQDKYWNTEMKNGICTYISPSRQDCIYFRILHKRLYAQAKSASCRLQRILRGIYDQKQRRYCIYR